MEDGPGSQIHSTNDPDDPDDTKSEKQEPELISPRRHTWSHSGSDRKDSFLDQESSKTKN